MMTYHVIADGALFVMPPSVRSKDKALLLAWLMGVEIIEGFVVVEGTTTTLVAWGRFDVQRRDWGVCPSPEDVRSWASHCLGRELAWGGDMAVVLRSLVRAVERLDELFSSPEARRYAPLVDDLLWLATHARRLLPERTGSFTPDVDLVVYHGGVSVYPCRNGDVLALYTYTTDPTDADVDNPRGAQFDVRDLARELGVEAVGLTPENPADHVRIICRAIDSGLL